MEAEGHKCGKCKHARGGIDPRVDGYRLFCKHPEVLAAESDDAPLCDWAGHYLLFEEGERKTPSAERVVWDFSLLYYRLKGTLLNVIEAQMEEGSRLEAAKKITENILSEKEKELQEFLRAVFDDWGVKK